MTNNKNYKSLLFLNLGLVYVIWGSTYLGVKIGLKAMDPLWLTALRFMIGGSIFFLISLIKKPFPTYNQIKGGFLIGFLLTGIGTSGVAYAIKFIPSGLVALLVALLPVWTFILDFNFFSKIKPSKLSLSGMALGVAGVLFLFNPFGISDTQEIKLFPLLLIMIGSISWALGSLLSSRIVQSAGLQGISIQMLSGGFCAAIFSIFTEKNQINSTINLHGESLWALVYLILIGSFIGYSSYVWLINNAPPLLTSTYAFVNPVVALILGFFWADEKFGVVTLSASILILLGVLLMTIGRRRRNFEE